MDFKNRLKSLFAKDSVNEEAPKSQRINLRVVAQLNAKSLSTSANLQAGYVIRKRGTLCYETVCLPDADPRHRFLLVGAVFQAEDEQAPVAIKTKVRFLDKYDQARAIVVEESDKPVLVEAGRQIMGYKIPIEALGLESFTMTLEVETKTSAKTGVLVRNLWVEYR